MKNYIILLSMLIASCATTKSNIQSYTVTDVKHVGTGSSVIKAKGLNGWFDIPSDTLKKGDRITITWIRSTTNFRRK